MNLFRRLRELAAIRWDRATKKSNFLRSLHVTDLNESGTLYNFQIVNLLTDLGFFMLHKGTPRKERLPNQVEDRIMTIHALARDESKVKDFKKPY